MSKFDELEMYSIVIGKTALVVDDNPDNLEIVSLLLLQMGMTVYTACNGLEGYEAAQQHKPDFIISDLSMPVMDGWEFVELLKRDRELMVIPVVALTAFNQPSDRERAIAAGFYNYLTKPLRLSTFTQNFLKLVVSFEDGLQA